MADIIHRVHKKKRTIIEEEEPTLPEETVSVSYLTNTHVVSSGSTVGMLISNFLIHMKRSVVTNVIFLDRDGEFKSLFNMDLRATIGELGLGPQLILALSGFEREEEAMISVTALRDFLKSAGRLPVEDEELLRNTEEYLRVRGNAPRARTQAPIRLERGTVRGSVDVVAPVVTTGRARSPVTPSRRQPQRKTRTVVVEDSETSSEEEVLPYPRR